MAIPLESQKADSSSIVDEKDASIRRTTFAMNTVSDIRADPTREKYLLGPCNEKKKEDICEIIREINNTIQNKQITYIIHEIGYWSYISTNKEGSQNESNILILDVPKSMKDLVEKRLKGGSDYEMILLNQNWIYFSSFSHGMNSAKDIKKRFESQKEKFDEILFIKFKFYKDISVKKMKSCCAFTDYELYFADAKNCKRKRGKDNHDNNSCYFKFDFNGNNNGNSNNEKNNNSRPNCCTKISWSNCYDKICNCCTKIFRNCYAKISCNCGTKISCPNCYDKICNCCDKICNCCTKFFCCNCISASYHRCKNNNLSCSNLCSSCNYYNSKNSVSEKEETKDDSKDKNNDIDIILTNDAANIVDNNVNKNNNTILTNDVVNTEDDNVDKNNDVIISTNNAANTTDNLNTENPNVSTSHSSIAKDKSENFIYSFALIRIPTENQFPDKLRLLEKYHLTNIFEPEKELRTRCETLTFIDINNLSFKASTEPISLEKICKEFVFPFIKFLCLPVYLFILLIIVPLCCYRYRKKDNDVELCCYGTSWDEDSDKKSRDIRYRINENPLRIFKCIRKYSFKPTCGFSICKFSFHSSCISYTCNFLLFIITCVIWCFVALGPIQYEKRYHGERLLPFAACYSMLILIVVLSVFFALWVYCYPQIITFPEHRLLISNLMINVLNAPFESDTRRPDIFLSLHTEKKIFVPLLQLLKQHGMLNHDITRTPLGRCGFLFLHDSTCKVVVHVLLLALMLLGWVVGVTTERILWGRYEPKYIVTHDAHIIFFTIAALLLALLLFLVLFWVYETMISRISRSLNEATFITKILRLDPNENFNCYVNLISEQNAMSWQMLHHYLVRKNALVFYNSQPAFVIFGLFTMLSSSFVCYSVFLGHGGNLKHRLLSNSNFISWAIWALYGVLLFIYIMYMGKKYQYQAHQMHKRIDRQMSYIQDQHLSKRKTIESLRKYLDVTTIVPKIFQIRIDELNATAVLGLIFSLAPTFLAFIYDNRNAF